jgi:CheY-like chemotaxis protein
MNLCANAAHAMRGPGGNLLLALDSTLLTAEEARPLSVSAGTYVRLRVSDTGHGIDPQILHSIFDPFFTTKKPDEGTGMGLALVHGIITAHGGTVSVSSVPGQGTDFTILLPATDGQNVSEPGGSLRHAGSGIVLVVDDEKALAGVMADMLQSMGYTPRIADSPAQALHMVSRAPQEFALVLAARLHAVRPDLPVILCTGFSEGLTREAARKAGISELLLKPVLRGDLAKALACLEFDCGL